MSSLYLVDTSVWSRGSKVRVADRLEPLLEAGRIATCGIQLTEALREVSNRKAVEALQNARAGLRWFSTPDEIWDRVLEVQGELSATGRRTAVKVPDLILAAVAERHRATVLHYDRDFDTIAEITAQPVEWVVPPGSVD